MNQSLPEQLRLAFVQARWHADIVDQSRLAFVQEIEHQIGGRAQVDVVDVPGAFELPLQCRMLARTGEYDAVIGAAFVVDGGIYRHEFVAQAVVSGLMGAQMDTDVPMFSVVLTPHHFHESEQHHRFFHDHFKVKGIEAANACLSLLSMRRSLATAA